MVQRLLKPFLLPSGAYLAVAAALGLTAIGIEAIGTAPIGASVGAVATKQTVFLLVGVGLMVAVALPHHKVIGGMAYPLAILTLCLLVLLLLPGMPSWLVPVRNGARRWIDMGVVQFQPSELAKVAFVLALARYLRYRQNYRTLLGLTVPLAITFVPMGLIVVEPDLGTAMVFLPVLFAMLLAAGARIKHLLLIILLGLIAMPMMYPLLRPHQKARIVAMVSQVRGDSSHLQGAGFQAHKAMTTAGAGQVRGYGKGQARTILRYNALPEAHNDMIFAVICARWGLIGGAAVLGLYLMLIGSSLWIAAVNKEPFARLIVVGIAAVVFTQVFVNIGMTLGLMPITGMTLPLISYGGSSLLINFGMIGLLLNVAARRPKLIARPSFEYDGAERTPVLRSPR